MRATAVDVEAPDYLCSCFTVLDICPLRPDVWLNHGPGRGSADSNDGVVQGHGSRVVSNGNRGEALIPLKDGKRWVLAQNLIRALGP